jgi:hypothetical protein
VGIDLADYARSHVCYELRMLVGTHALLSRAVEPIEHDAAVESFLLHARVLDDFLGCAEPRKGDVVARHYVDTWQPVHPLTPELRRSIDKRLAQLTEERVDKESIQILSILAAVAAGFRRFLGTLPAEQQPWFAQAARQISALSPFVFVKAASDASGPDAFTDEI